MEPTTQTKPIEIKTLTGYLTQTNKVHIRAILALDLMEGKINRTTYHIEPLPEVNCFIVRITANTTAWCETKPRIQTSKHTFKLG